VTLGTGVGGSIVLDGRFVKGAHGIAGEVGHMCVDVKGPVCGCGGRGCLEQFVGNARIVERAILKIRNGAPGEAIQRAAGGGDAPVTPKAIAQAASEGDWTAGSVFREIGEILGTTLAGVGNLLGLDVIVLGGGVAEAGEVLFAPAREALERRSMFPRHQKPRLLPSRFGIDAGLVGACAFARDRRPSRA
jgi:glucokinase